MEQRSNPITEEEFIEQYNITPHLGKLAVKFKIPVIQVWRLSKKLNLTFKNGGSNKRIPLEEILEGKHNYYPTGKLKKRLIKEKYLEYKCVSCNLDTWKNEPIPLELDHIDGVSTNHMLENLRLLCPNCHSQTDTWCGKNKKNK